MQVRTHRGALAAATCVLSLANAACGGDDSSDGPSSGSIVATTSIWADITGHLACDVDPVTGEAMPAEVTALVPAGGDPHAFEPSLRDREVLEDADVVVMNGGGLEASVEDAIASAESDGAIVIRAVDHVSLLDGADPHVWMDPMQVRAVLPALADALVAAGADPATVTTCRAAYDDRLVALDAEITETLRPLSPEQRQLVTSHEALAYFADRYGFTIVGAVIPGGSSLGESNAADLHQLAQLVESTGVRTVFAEEQHSAEDLEALANEVGDVAIVSLHTDALGEDGTGAETYVGLLRTDAALIAEGLTR
jgi:zinc/manganese transport system substrate-binding protein